MLGQLGRHRPLDQPLRQPLQQTIGAGELLRCAGAGQQLVDQLVRQIRTINVRGDDWHRLLRVVLGHCVVSFPSRPAAPGPPGRERRHPLNSDHAYTENRTDPDDEVRVAQRRQLDQAGAVRKGAGQPVGGL
jgi:hypothetical protein